MAEAIDTFKQAISADRANVVAKFNCALLLAGQGDHAAAAAYLEEIVSAAPDDNEARLALARSREALGDVAEALRQAELVLRLDPSNADALRVKTRLGNGP